MELSPKQALMVRCNNLRSSIFHTMRLAMKLSQMPNLANERYKEMQHGTVNLEQRNEIVKKVRTDISDHIDVVRQLAEAYEDLGKVNYNNSLKAIKLRLKAAEDALAAGYDRTKFSNTYTNNLNGTIKCKSQKNG